MNTIRRIYVGDNLQGLHHLGDNEIDLIYLDPPYNTGRTDFDTHHGGKFNDRDFYVSQDEMQKTKDRNPPSFEFIQGIANTLPISTIQYLYFMTSRLLELHRVLKPTGSIFLQCDHNMMHFLRIIMTNIFGPQNYRSTITWKRTFSKPWKLTQSLGNISDYILYL